MVMFDIQDADVMCTIDGSTPTAATATGSIRPGLHVEHGDGLGGQVHPAGRAPMR
jgi:hypothetical protein